MRWSTARWVGCLEVLSWLRDTDNPPTPSVPVENVLQRIVAGTGGAMLRTKRAAPGVVQPRRDDGDLPQVHDCTHLGHRGRRACLVRCRMERAAVDDTVDGTGTWRGAAQVLVYLDACRDPDRVRDAPSSSKVRRPHVASSARHVCPSSLDGPCLHWGDARASRGLPCVGNAARLSSSLARGLAGAGRPRFLRRRMAAIEEAPGHGICSALVAIDITIRSASATTPAPIQPRRVP